MYLKKLEQACSISRNLIYVPKEIRTGIFYFQEPSICVSKNRTGVFYFQEPSICISKK